MEGKKITGLQVIALGIVLFCTLTHNSKVWAESLPSKYDPRELGLVSPVKEQKLGRGNCWTHATDAVESYLIKNGESMIFSENYYNYLISENATGTIGENPYSKIISSGSTLDQGFTVTATFDAMLDWKGPVYTQDFPESITGYQPLSKWQNLKPAKHVQGTVTIPSSSDNISTEENSRRVNKIKEMVSKYGNANTSNFFSISGIFDQNVSKEQYRYFNHYSTIVGWDDNYSRDHFSTKPSQNGAFIVKNTWGKNWGYGGYYYISYEDWQVKLSEITSISSVEDTDNYDKKYNGAYKIGGSLLRLDPNKKRTVSVTYSRNENEQEQLTAVALRTTDENIKYEIYVSPNGKPTDRLNGFQKIQEGVKSEGGVETIRLFKPITLTGNEFSIAIVYQSENKSWVPVSSKIANDPLKTQANYMSDDGKWQSNLYDTYFITGFTNKKISVEPTNININKTNVSLTVGDKEQLTGTVFPENSTYNTVGYRSTRPDIATVTATGEISALKAGNSIIEVYPTKNSTIKKQVQVEVKDRAKIQAIKLSKSTTVLKKNTTELLTAQIEPANAAAQKIIWSTNNPLVASVDQQGKIKWKGPGMVVITAVTEDGSVKAECKVDSLSELPLDGSGFSSIMWSEDGYYNDRSGLVVANNKESTIYCQYAQAFISKTKDKWIDVHFTTQNGNVLRPVTYPEFSFYQETSVDLQELNIEYTIDGENYTSERPSLDRLEGFRVQHAPQLDKGLSVYINMQFKLNTINTQDINRWILPLKIENGYTYSRYPVTDVFSNGIDPYFINRGNILINNY